MAWNDYVGMYDCSQWFDDSDGYWTGAGVLTVSGSGYVSQYLSVNSYAFSGVTVTVGLSNTACVEVHGDGQPDEESDGFYDTWYGAFQIYYYICGCIDESSGGGASVQASVSANWN